MLPTSWCPRACGCVSEGNPHGLCTEVVKLNIRKDFVNKHHFLLPLEPPLCFVTAVSFDGTTGSLTRLCGDKERDGERRV